MPKRVAILQSNYVPWKGYFDIIHDVDEFLFLDDVQYTTRDWRNRNRIKTARGVEWLTIPTGANVRRRICDVELPDSSWAEAHWRRITAAYKAAPHFAALRGLFEELYLGRTWRLLSDFNQHVIRTIAHDLLGIATTFRDSRELAVTARRQERLIELLGRTGANVYVSGPAARAYIDESQFAGAGIEVIWKSYDGYPEYPQFHPPFEHRVSILDLLFHTGADAAHYIWGWRTPRMT